MSLKCPQCRWLNSSYTTATCIRCGASLSAATTSDRPLLAEPRLLIATALSVGLLGGVGWWLGRPPIAPTVTPNGAQPTPATPYSSEAIRDTILSYLAQPDFSGTKLEAQVLGTARLELVQLDDREVYFSLPRQENASSIEALTQRFIRDPKQITVAQQEKGELRLGRYSLAQTADKWQLFKTPVDNVKIDPSTVLKFPFKRATYTIELRELIDFIDNRSLFGGLLNADTGRLKGGVPIVFANHGAFVARPEETSLRRFAQALVRDIPDGPAAREQRVQRVLDFVSQEILYNNREATYQVELLKRPNEVLMTAESDCSNKAILLGSLLEQLGEDYLFVYLPQHISVAVRQGNFSNENNLGLQWQGETWLIAESTASGFQVGKSRLKEDSLFQQLQYVQRPKEKSTIFDVATGQALYFR